MSIVLNSAGGGSITLNEPNTASNRVLELPNNSGTLISTGSTFAGNGPAFSASRTADQSISSSTWTKVALNVEAFDTNSCFDSTTNYRFTPNVAGYYQVNGRLFGGGSSVVSTYVAIYKNGSLTAQAGVGVGSGTVGVIPQIADVIYFNGTTDYVELYGYVAGTSPIFSAATGQFCVFSASMVRAA